jgi:hypothetical protein
MLASDVLTRVRLLLQDPLNTATPPDGVRWLNAELFQWLTDGERAVVVVRPDASSLNVELQLVAGSKQTLPAGGLRLLDVVRNIPTTVAGASAQAATVNAMRAVRLVDREVLDAQDPLWHSRKAATVIRNYCYDNRDPTHFYVSPPAVKPDQRTGIAKLEIIYVKLPATVTKLDDTLDLSDIYLDPLVNYVLFRCYSKDSAFSQNAQLASAYLQTFMGLLNLKTKKDVAFSPDLHSKGSSPDGVAIQMEST